jgi:protein subunit release factor B
MKDDIDDEYSVQLENKETELLNLKNENAELTQKLKDAEKYTAITQIEKAKDTEVKTIKSTLQEPLVEYSHVNESDNNQLIKLKEKVRAFEKLQSILISKLQ